MNMPGMGAASHDGSLGLLPFWLGVIWTVVFVVVAISHLRHMANTTGQRRPWHACHVLMAIGMADMFAPSGLDPLNVPVGVWKLGFAAAGLIAAVWAVGGVGRTATVIWLLTSVDLGVMLYMWSGAGRAGNAPVSWTMAAYLIAEALAWGFDLYRRIDGEPPLVMWQLLAVQPAPSGLGGAGGGIGPGGRRGQPRRGFSEAAAVEQAGSLLGTLDISASMIAMTLGMAYMLVAMQLAV